MRRVAFPLAVVALGILAFLAWMHPAVLWPTNVGWLLAGDDRGQSAIGLAAYLRAGDGWLHQPLLAAPEGMALLFTDSIPLLGLVLTPVAGLLPASVQFIGLWYLACCLLQASFAALLVRRYTSEPLPLWGGALLLTLFPVLLNRFGHASLCAQWLLLWSLWIFVEPRRAERPWWWAAALAVAALVHSYLMLMVAAFWSGAVLARLWSGHRRLRVLVGAVLAAAPAVLLLAGHGVFAGPYASTGSFGEFPAALDAWWNPANPDLTALPISSPALPNGRGFEGFGYLGAGLLVLVALAAGRLVRRDTSAVEQAMLRRMAWLMPAFAMLAVVAIGPAPVWRGHPLFGVPLPHGLTDSLDAVRASGRLMWPVTYSLALAAVACTVGMRRATLVIGAALALQVVDLAPMIVAVRGTSARADDARVFTRTRDPRWAALIRGASAVQFEPARPFTDMALMEEIGWRAVAACRPLRSFYASRDAAATRRRIDADGRAFRAGGLAPSRLYILVAEAPVPASVAARVTLLDGVRVIAPSRVAPPPSCGPAPPSAS